MSVLLITMMFLGYLSGSLCSAVVVCKLFHLADPREQGSMNPGATNVLRLHGKKYAAWVLIGDMLKGTFPVLLGHLLFMASADLGWISLACVLGHMYPLYFQFKGGKGVATALGCYFGIHVLFGLSTLGLWIFMVWLKRFSSLGSVTVMIFAPLLGAIFTSSSSIILPLFIISGVVLVKHKANIERLLKGKEDKVKF
jgi:glycerol-3-phosphate acyltransferase PlsY